MADEITPNIQTPQTESQIELISEPVEVAIPSESDVAVAETEPTAQIPVSEPLPIPTEIEAEPVAETIPEETKPVESEIQSKPISEPIPKSVKEGVKPEIPESIKTESKQVEQIRESKLEQESKPESEQPKIIPIIIPNKNLTRELLVKARNAIQFRKRKKLDKIMTLFAKQTKITNDEVEKFLHISDATATRYLSQLEKEGKIKQSGKTGKSVFYSKI